MKKILISLGLLLSGNFSLYAADCVFSHPQLAESANIESCHKRMLNVITYDEKGDLLHSGYGFFLTPDGAGVAAYTLFKNAHKAIVIDYSGKKYPVTRILGASSTYDLVKFAVGNHKTFEYFKVASTPIRETGSGLYLSVYTGKKKAKAIPVSIEKSSDFETYKYFEVSAENTTKNIGCPLTDNKGEVVAIVQKNLEENAQNACAIDARFVSNLKISSTSILNSDLNAIQIPKALPATEKEALTYIYMLGNRDSVTALQAHNDFVQTYPENAEGYCNRAAYFAHYHQYDFCEADFTKALELSENESSTMRTDMVHNNFSKIIYNDVVNPDGLAESRWTMDKAIEEAEKAYQLHPSPHYLLQQGHCLFAKKEYRRAYEKYHQMNTEKFPDEKEWSPQAQSEAWLYAARAYEFAMKENKNGATKKDSIHVLCLLDSAITILPQDFLPQNSQLILERAQRHVALQQYRNAVFDYNEYEKLIGPKNLNDKFYYLREQAEIRCHMYQQALDDIRTAMAFNSDDPFYPVEEAVVLLQAGMFEEAISACEKSLEALPENPDCYKIMGIAYGELKNKKKALFHLQKAQKLGDPTINPLIQKYK